MNVFSHTNLGTIEERGDNAKGGILQGTDMIGEILKTTLGPKGMMKLLKGKSINVTNDGAFIMKNLQIDSAAARILTNSSVSQDWEEGDGTTSVAVLSSLLINEASKLNIHPSKIIKGFRLAQSKCEEILKKICFVPDRDDVVNLAATTLCSKVLKCDLYKFSEMCVKAVERLDNRQDIDMVQIIKCTGKLEDSYLADGFILKKNIEVPHVFNPKILVVNTAMDQDKIKVFGAKVNVRSVNELCEMESSEKRRVMEKIDKICAIKFDFLINRQLIYDYPTQLLKQRNVCPVELADFIGVERLNNVLGGKVISTFDNISESALGTCDEITNITIGNENAIQFIGVKNGASTIVLCGSSKEMLDEAERSVHDALCVVSRIKEDPRVLYGGGASEMSMAVELAKYALEVHGVESEAIIAFSNALQQISKILATNGGYDGEALKTALRARHYIGEITYGIDTGNGSLCCMKKKGVIDSFRMKRRVITAASETAQMIVKCDGYIKCSPRERTRE